MPFVERHVFICTNERPPDNPKGSCTARGSGAVVDAFKRELSERGLAGRLRAQRAGCLDYCRHGVTVVVYPDGIWYGAVTPEDVREIVESHLLEGRPVERLRIAVDAPRG